MCMLGDGVNYANDKGYKCNCENVHIKIQFILAGRQLQAETETLPKIVSTSHSNA